MSTWKRSSRLSLHKLPKERRPETVRANNLLKNFYFDGKKEYMHIFLPDQCCRVLFVYNGNDAKEKKEVAMVNLK